MPNRIIKESICTSENIDSLSQFAEIAFYRLMVNCDDYGRFDARPKVVKARLFPLKIIKESEIIKALNEMVKADLIVIYEIDGKQYLQMKTWDRHQTIRAKKSKYPAFDDNCKHLQADEIICNQMNADENKCSRNPIQSESISESVSVSKSSMFTPPTIDDVERYCDEKGIFGFDAQKFVDYYESIGWMVGKHKMKSWEAAIRTWLNNDRKKREQEQRDYDLPM